MSAADLDPSSGGTPLQLEWIDGRFAVCRLEPAAPLPDWARWGEGLLSITRTDRELSIVVPEGRVPPGVVAEPGWAALRVVGPLDFSQVGVLARLSGALAAAGVPLLAISTYETDVLLVRASDLPAAVMALGRMAEIHRGGNG